MPSCHWFPVFDLFAIPFVNVYKVRDDFVEITISVDLALDRTKVPVTLRRVNAEPPELSQVLQADMLRALGRVSGISIRF